MDILKLALVFPLFTLTAACEAPVSTEELAAAEEQLTASTDGGVGGSGPDCYPPLSCQCPHCAPIECNGAPLIYACHTPPGPSHTCTEHWADCDNDGYPEHVWRCQPFDEMGCAP